MKHLIITLAILASVAANAQIGVDAMAIQKARNVATANNNRNVDPYDTPAPAPAAPAAPAAAPAPAPLTPGQLAYSHFQSDLYSANPDSSAAVKQKFATDLAAVAQKNKPSSETAAKLAGHLTTALAEANKLNSAKKTRVAQEVAILLNSAATPAAQKQAMIKDVQTTLTSGGASAENADAVGADLQTVTDEIQKPAAR